VEGYTPKNKKSEENTRNRIHVFWMLVPLFEIRRVIAQKNIYLGGFAGS